MMSLIDLDDDQRWVPTHVNVTVLRARGLRTKGKHGSRYLYTIIQVGKEKYTTGLVEKAEVPEWNEECCFELLPGILEDGGRGSYPPGSGDLVLTVMHRVLIGLDVFLGQTIIPLDKIFQDGMCPRDEWFKLNSKLGRKEKERGELQVTVQFTRNNMTASMFDLTMKDKPRSAFGKLKDRVTGRKRGDMESSSAIVPGRYAALSGSLGQPFGEEGGGALEPPDTEVAEKKSKVKDFFKGRLRKSSDTRSCSSLASDSSVFSMSGDNPPPSLDLLSDPPSSPVYSSKVRMDPHYGEADLAKKVLTSQHTTKILTHKRAFSDEASKITTAFPRPNPAVESLKGQSMTQSKSSLCINGSHVYDSEPSTPKSAAAHPSKLVLPEKCSPLSRSLQNLTRRSEDKGYFAEGRRWSFDKMKREDKEKEKETQDSSSSVSQTQTEGQAAASRVSSTSDSPPDKGRKLRKTIFSGGRSDSLPAKTDPNQAASSSEGRLRGWFGSGDAQNKPRLEVSPKVESSSDVSPPVPPCSPVPPHNSSALPSGHVSSDDCNHANPFISSPSPSSTPSSTSNPLPPHTQRNPFIEELIAAELQRSPVAPCPSSGSSPFNYTSLPYKPGTLSPVYNASASNMASIKRERPRPVARQISLPALLPRAAVHNSPKDSAPRSMSESTGEWEDSFDAFASIRFNSPKGRPLQREQKMSPTCYGQRCPTVNHAQKLCEEDPPPLPPRRLLRTSGNEVYSDGWLHRGQELAVHKEAYLLSQTGVASLQHGRELECKRNNNPSDRHTRSEDSQPYTSMNSLGFASEEALKKFKYEPLEDEANCWGGMLFEQDLYGRVCRGNLRQPKVNLNLSLNAEKRSTNQLTSTNSGPKFLLDNQLCVADLLNLSVTPSKPDAKMIDVPTTHIEETKSVSPEAMCINNASLPPTPTPTKQLCLNASNSDFSFIDTDGSSHSESFDTLKSIESLSVTVPKTPEDSRIGSYHAERPQDIFTLKDTYIPETNSSFEITASSNKLCKVSQVCQGNCQNCTCETNDGTLQINGRETHLLCSQPPNPMYLESSGVPRCSDSFKNTQKEVDDNGNPQGKTGALNQVESFSGVVSARLRPKGVRSRTGSPDKQSKSGDREFEQLLSLVQNFSGASEGPLSYQPTKSALYTLMSSNQQIDLQGGSVNKSQTHHDESNMKTDISPHDNPPFFLSENGRISFEDLHAKVAPPSKTEPSLRVPEPSSCLIPRALSQSANASPHPTFPCYPSTNPSSVGPSAGASTSLAVAPTSTFSFITSNTELPLVDAPHSLLPEKTQPASNLPHQESRPHPVKPLTSSQPEKKESRSVLEKLKSTINPGRAANQAAAEAEKNQEEIASRSAQYQHLTNMELISLLLQQEMDMQKQQAASEQQAAQLRKCEAELKKVKLQVRDLEDYIDNLLLRIMEQTPTLLQVRSRHK